jgi:hypothetical protein
MNMGTRVKNPTHRLYGKPFTMCKYCKKYYTNLGVSRHWAKCPKNPINIKE